MPVQDIASHRSRKRWILPLIALLLVVAVVGPPLISLNRLHRRIAESISLGIGRPVRMSSIKMHLLPRPGFELGDFLVEEDPAFGAEPILRSVQVMAYLRLLSLWRGRLEIARIAFDEPSVNLVRNPEGRWNFEQLLSQAAQAPNAPTGERHPGRLIRFPYIDATNARVNFKLGDEKMPFSFLNADLAVWLANPSEWRIQFAAQPVRTDLSLDLANTGLVRLEGSLYRAPKLTEMPIKLHVEWSRAPLGQLSRILTGSDADWRGQLDAVADIAGNADHAQLNITARGSDIHRVEFQPHQPFNLQATCRTQFARVGRSFDNITCLVPAGEGHLLLTGSIAGLSPAMVPRLSVEVNHLPVSSAIDAVRLVRSGFAPTIQATGVIDGTFRFETPPAAERPRTQGSATATRVTVALPELDQPLVLPPLRFTLDAPGAADQGRRPRGLRRQVPSNAAEEPADLMLQPFAIKPASSASALSSLNVSGAFNRRGFSVHIGGQGTTGEVMALGREFGVLRSRSVNFAPQGQADLDLTARGPWLPTEAGLEQPANPATVEGSLRLRNAQLAGPFLAGPVQIAVAQASFSGGRVDWTSPALVYGPVHASGTLSYPVLCDSPDCARKRFTLHVASLDAAAAQQALYGSHRGEWMDQMVSRLRRGEPAWPALQGRVQIDSLVLERLSLENMVAMVAVESSSVKVDDLTCQALGGTVHLDGLVQMESDGPHYTVDAQLSHAAATAFAGVFQENWGPGVIDLTTSLKFSGSGKKQLLSSAVGTFHSNWAHGGLPAARPASETTTSISAQLPFEQWTAEGEVGKGRLTLDRSQLEIPSGAATGTVSLIGRIDFNRELDLTTAAEEPTQIRISGTLANPEISGRLAGESSPSQP